MENEISFKAIAEVQADHKLALFCHLGLRSRLITVLPPLSPWTVDSAQGGMRCQSYNSGSFCHRRLKTDRWFPQVHPRPYSKTQGFRITKGDSCLLYYIFCSWFVCASLQRLALCSTNFYNIVENSVLLSHFLSPMHKEQNGTRYVRPAFCIYLSRYSPHCFKNCNTLV